MSLFIILHASKSTTNHYAGRQVIIGSLAVKQIYVRILTATSQPIRVSTNGYLDTMATGVGPHCSE